MAKTRKRKSLSLRLQPYEGSALAEVVDYLNSLEKEEATKKVGDILLMCLLPYARKHSSHPPTQAELRLCCLESCDCMDKHASTMRQALRVEQPKFFQPYTVAPSGYNGNGGEMAAEAEVEDEEISEIVPRTIIEGNGYSKGVDLFGL